MAKSSKPVKPTPRKRPESAKKAKSVSAKKPKLTRTRRQFLRGAGVLALAAMVPANACGSVRLPKAWLDLVKIRFTMTESGSVDCGDYQFLGVPYSAQDCDNWCWAACVKMVSDYYISLYDGCPFWQRDIVGQAIYNYGSFCENNHIADDLACEDQYGINHLADCTGYCDQGFSLSAGLSVTGNNGGAGSTDFDEIAAQICAGCPVLISIARPMECASSPTLPVPGDPNECYVTEDEDCIEAHTMLIAGFDRRYGSQKIYIMDPVNSNNNGWWDYDSFPSYYAQNEEAYWLGADYTCVPSPIVRC